MKSREEAYEAYRKRLAAQGVSEDIIAYFLPVIWENRQEAYQEGYQEGYQIGYREVCHEARMGL